MRPWALAGCAVYVLLGAGCLTPTTPTDPRFGKEAATNPALETVALGVVLSDESKKTWAELEELSVGSAAACSSP